MRRIVAAVLTLLCFRQISGFSEVEVLLEMKMLLDDPMHVLKSWQRENEAALCINWMGIRCDARGRVIEIRLEGQKLGGVLPASLSNLTFLQELSLQKNHLNGALPFMLDNAHLQVIQLSHNRFKGPFPFTHPLSWLSSLGRCVRTLSLAHNEISGVIPGAPPAYYRHSVLEQLDLSHNRLEGALPLGFEGLHCLLYLNLGDNPELMGPVPRGWKHFNFLNTLSFRNDWNICGGREWVDHVHRLDTKNSGLENGCAGKLDAETHATQPESLPDAESPCSPLEIIAVASESDLAPAVTVLDQEELPDSPSFPSHEANQSMQEPLDSANSQLEPANTPSIHEGMDALSSEPAPSIHEGMDALSSEPAPTSHAGMDALSSEPAPTSHAGMDVLSSDPTPSDSIPPYTEPDDAQDEIQPSSENKDSPSRPKLPVIPIIPIIPKLNKDDDDDEQNPSGIDGPQTEPPAEGLELPSIIIQDLPSNNSSKKEPETSTRGDTHPSSPLIPQIPSDLRPSPHLGLIPNNTQKTENVKQHFAAGKGRVIATIVSGALFVIILSTVAYLWSMMSSPTPLSQQPNVFNIRNNPIAQEK